MTERLPIIIAPNPILKKKSIKISTFDDDFKKFIDNLAYTASSDPYCGGLSAPQVGYNYHAFIVNMSFFKSPYKMVNAKILKHSKETCVMKEGCLSLPDIYLNIERPESVLVKYMDEFGTTYEEQFTGGEARCIQHELDHLNGILMIDGLSKDRQDFILKSITSK